MYKIGLDLGSTTIKCVVLDEQENLVFHSYERHSSKIMEKARKLMDQLASQLDQPAALAISGSAGMGLAELLEVPFVQEVYAARKALGKYQPDADVCIELGGEDAKILFLNGTLDVCMNGTCAGGTGAFIDQMAVLLHLSTEEMNQRAKNAGRLYPIASRCGVFAKSDIQPLLNQGASFEDISASIFQAVVCQTIAGLAHGRSIEGNVVYLGGPLTFMDSLRQCFDKNLNLQGICPEDSLYYVALGAALSAGAQAVDLSSLARQAQQLQSSPSSRSLRPLFGSRQEQQAFERRHPKPQLPANPTVPCYEPLSLYVGMDAGSTTVKCTAIDDYGAIRLWSYEPGGEPVASVQRFLQQLYTCFPAARIMGSAATGYGEDLIKAAFHVDDGLVETAAHFLAARHYDPLVDFILDIGGQDIKCFKIRGGAIDQIFLNEACSSGCGSFLQTFSETLGFSLDAFSQIALEGKHPVDLGSRCTVFMNSSVKEAQKEGAGMDDIAAGLAYSVVKNALYKVIRLPHGQPPGQHILVQGGTFLNDAVLRAFELETQTQVTRPDAAGLMGALGAALYARSCRRECSTLLTRQALQHFTHTKQALQCQGCTNHCALTRNTFSDGSTWIAGNQCSRPLGRASSKAACNLWAYKRELIGMYGDVNGHRKTIGLPLVLNMWELMPFWHTFFRTLGFSIRVSGCSTKETYRQGQSLIPSDTACYPAKLVHGHLKQLADQGVDVLFYPCLSYNLDEHMSVNHYNCPVVAYYPEVADSTWNGVSPLLHPYLGLHAPRHLPERLRVWLQEALGETISKKEVQAAVSRAYAALDFHMRQIRGKGEAVYRQARAEGQPVLILAGRPYHADPEVLHGIDTYIASTGTVVLSEDSIQNLCARPEVDVLNQWTYHARLYAAAEFAAREDVDLVQLVSFGCGLDAITSDEVRAIAEEQGRLYTQLKIDETTSLGAAKIRLRSLFAWKEEQRNDRSNSVCPVYKGNEEDPHHSYSQHDGNPLRTGPQRVAPGRI